MLKRSFGIIVLISLIVAVSGCRNAFLQAAPAPPPGSIRNGTGLQLMVAEENNFPTLRIILPGHRTSDRAIEVVFPEHVTVRPHGSTDGHQIYLYQPGLSGERPLWRQSKRSLDYEKNLPGPVHMLARATLEEDGVRFYFRLRNQSDQT